MFPRCSTSPASPTYGSGISTGAPAEPLVVGPAPFKNPFDWSPDGKYLIYEQLGEVTNMDLWLAPTDGSGEPRPYVEDIYNESDAHFSPDGRWVAYTIIDAGPRQVVNSFPVPSQPHRVSIDMGGGPRWQADGKAIFFAAFIEESWVLARASFQAEPLRTGIPQMIFEFPLDLRPGGWGVDEHRMLVLRTVAPPRDESVTVVLNWTRLLENEDR